MLSDWGLKRYLVRQVQISWPKYSKRLWMRRHYCRRWRAQGLKNSSSPARRNRLLRHACKASRECERWQEKGPFNIAESHNPLSQMSLSSESEQLNETLTHRQQAPP